MRLLVVEDDPMIARAVRHVLTKAGFTVDVSSDGESGLAAACNGVYDLVVLDLGLPRLDGLALLQALRDRHDSIPVLVTSARDTVGERIKSLNAGADDYLLKPFDLEELLARVRALMRRRAGLVSHTLVAGSVELDPVQRTVTQSDRRVHLTAKEFSLLETLLQRPGAVLSRERLEESIYGWDEEIGSNAVEVHLHNLRRKLGQGVIVNIRGIGYRIGE